MIMHRFLHIEEAYNFLFRGSASFLLGLVIINLAGCQTEYERMVSRELNSGIRKDSLFLGISLGMSSKDFYQRCWDLNKQKLIRQGSGNTTVLWDLTELKDTADVNFYPSFYYDSILEMSAHVSYKAWAPWNKHLSNDSLLVDVVTLLKQWYGGEFIKIDFPDVGIVYVKVDGNRRIMASKFGESQVKIIFTDLLMEKRKEEEIAND